MISTIFSPKKWNSFEKLKKWPNELCYFFSQLPIEIVTEITKNYTRFKKRKFSLKRYGKCDFLLQWLLINLNYWFFCISLLTFHVILKYILRLGSFWMLISVCLSLILVVHFAKTNNISSDFEWLKLFCFLKHFNFKISIFQARVTPLQNCCEKKMFVS